MSWNQRMSWAKGKNCESRVRIAIKGKNWNQALVSPPPRIGGVAAHQENAAKPPLKAQTGWSFQTDHPGRALLTFDGASTPPILGGD